MHVQERLAHTGNLLRPLDQSLPHDRFDKPSRAQSCRQFVSDSHSLGFVNQSSKDISKDMPLFDLDAVSPQTFEARVKHLAERYGKSLINSPQ